MAPELNFLCNLQNLGFKLHDLIFSMQSLTKSKSMWMISQQGCTRMAIICRHMLRHLGVGPSNLQHSVNIIQLQKVKEQLI
jgi:hypothetical protein